jgi:hypothetical protein
MALPAFIAMRGALFVGQRVVLGPIAGPPCRVPSLHSASGVVKLVSSIGQPVVSPVSCG